jgi:hypothetical protein
LARGGAGGLLCKNIFKGTAQWKHLWDYHFKWWFRFKLRFADIFLKFENRPFKSGDITNRGTLDVKRVSLWKIVAFKREILKFKKLLATLSVDQSSHLKSNSHTLFRGTVPLL